MDLVIVLLVATLYIGWGLVVSSVAECETATQKIVLTMLWPVVMLMVAMAGLLLAFLSGILYIADLCVKVVDGLGGK